MAFADGADETVAEHARRFGAATISPDPASHLGCSPGSRRNSPTRTALPVEVAERMDCMGVTARSELVGRMRRRCVSRTYDEVAEALLEVLAGTGAVRVADVEMMLARIGGFGPGAAPDAGPDLTAYDRLAGGGTA